MKTNTLSIIAFCICMYYTNIQAMGNTSFRKFSPEQVRQLTAAQSKGNFSSRTKPQGIMAQLLYQPNDNAVFEIPAFTADSNETRTAQQNMYAPRQHPTLSRSMLTAPISKKNTTTQNSKSIFASNDIESGNVQPKTTPLPHNASVQYPTPSPRTSAMLKPQATAADPTTVPAPRLPKPTKSQPLSITFPLRSYTIITPQGIAKGVAIKQLNNTTQDGITLDPDSISIQIKEFKKSPRYKNLTQAIPEIFATYVLDTIHRLTTHAQQPQLHDIAQQEQKYNWITKSKKNDRESLPNLYMGMQELEKILSLPEESRIFYEQLNKIGEERLEPGKRIDYYVKKVGEQFPHVPTKIIQSYVFSFFNDPDNIQYALIEVPQTVTSYTQEHIGLSVPWFLGGNTPTQKTKIIPDPTKPLHTFSETTLLNIPLPETPADLKEFQKLYLTMQAIEKINSKRDYTRYLEPIDTAESIKTQLKTKFTPTDKLSVETQLASLSTMKKQLQDEIIEVETPEQQQMHSMLDEVENQLKDIQKATEQKLQAAKQELQKQHDPSEQGPRRQNPPSNDELPTKKTKTLITEKEIVEEAIKPHSDQNKSVQLELTRKLNEITEWTPKAQKEVTDLWNRTTNKNEFLTTLFDSYIQELQKNPIENQELITSLTKIKNDKTIMPENIDKQDFAAIKERLKKTINSTGDQSAKASLNRFLITFEQAATKLDMFKFEEDKKQKATNAVLAYRDLLTPQQGQKGALDARKMLIFEQNIQEIENKIIEIKTKLLEPDAITRDTERKKLVKEFKQKLGLDIKKQLTDPDKNNINIDSETSLSELLTMYTDIAKKLREKQTAITEEAQLQQVVGNVKQGLNNLQQGQFNAGGKQIVQAVIATPQAVGEIIDRVNVNLQDTVGEYLPTLPEESKVKLREKIAEYAAGLIILSGATATTAYLNQNEKDKLQQEFNQAFAQDVANIIIADKTGADLDVVATGNIHAIGTNAFFNKAINVLAPEADNALLGNDPASSKMMQFQQKYSYIFAPQNSGFDFAQHSNSSLKPFLSSEQSTPPRPAFSLPSYHEILAMDVAAAA